MYVARISLKCGVGYEWLTFTAQRHTLVPRMRASAQRPEHTPIPLRDVTDVTDVTTLRLSDVPEIRSRKDLPKATPKHAPTRARPPTRSPNS